MEEEEEEAWLFLFSLFYLAQPARGGRLPFCGLQVTPPTPNCLPPFFSSKPSSNDSITPKC